MQLQTPAASLHRPRSLSSKTLLALQRCKSSRGLQPLTLPLLQKSLPATSSRHVQCSAKRKSDMEREDEEVLYRFQEGGGRPQVIGFMTGSVSVQANLSLLSAIPVFCCCLLWTGSMAVQAALHVRCCSVS